VLLWYFDLSEAWFQSLKHPSSHHPTYWKIKITLGFKYTWCKKFYEFQHYCFLFNSALFLWAYSNTFHLKSADFSSFGIIQCYFSLRLWQSWTKPAVCGKLHWHFSSNIIKVCRVEHWLVIKIQLISNSCHCK